MTVADLMPGDAEAEVVAACLARGSEAGAPDIAWAVKTLGAQRVMLGTDHPTNVAVEITKIREMGVSQSDVDMVLGGTAIQVFGLDI